MAQRQSMDSHDGIPLTEYPLEMEERHVSDINGYSCSTQRNEGAHKVHNIYSYLILSFHLTLLWITRQNLVKTLQISSTELSLLYGAYILLLLLMWDIKHNRIISSNHLRATTNPGSIYLTLCNLLYLFVLLHYSYLNMTYSCATKPSAFGFMLLMPYECASLYDQDDYRARLSMFAALASGQLFFCHLVMLAYNSKDPRLSPLRQKIMLGL